MKGKIKNQSMKLNVNKTYIMEYFGTDLRDYGHYRFMLTEKGLLKIWNRFEELPFNPESLTNNLSNGKIAFYQGGGYSVLAISGSPKDKRPGSKSVFWVKLNIDKSQLIEMVKENKTAMSIINTMPFEIGW